MGDVATESASRSSSLPEIFVSLATESSQVFGLVAILYARWTPE